MMSYEFVALAVCFSFLNGYGVKMWQDSVAEWRCTFLQKYKYAGNDHTARCELGEGHLGPHRTRCPGHVPDHYENKKLERSE